MMSDMPEKIWASFDDYRTWTFEPYADYQKQYYNTNQLIEWLEGQKHSDSAAENGYYCSGYNQAIDAVIEKLRKENQ